MDWFVDYDHRPTINIVLVFNFNYVAGDSNQEYENRRDILGKTMKMAFYGFDVEEEPEPVYYYLLNDDKEQDMVKIKFVSTSGEVWVCVKVLNMCGVQDHYSWSGL